MEKEEIKETEYVDLVEKYYKLALKRGVSRESKKIWEQGIVKLNFDVIEEFQLIKDIGNVYNVFIEKDSNVQI